MISEQNVTLIVSTCSLMEKGRTKCHKFWLEPDDDLLAVSSESDEFVSELEAIGIRLKAEQPEV